MFNMNSETTQNVMQKVYVWMCTGLLISAASSYGLLFFPELLTTIFSSVWYLFGIFALEIGLVIYISAYINKMRYSTAAFAFMLYSFVSGITLAPIFIMYEMPSIALTFACTAGMFGVMALYGYITKTDLTSMGNLMIMALLGLIIASLSNLYFQNGTFDYILAFIGVIIFTALTAYDVQKIKQLIRMVEYEGDQEAYGETISKVALLGALTLYLDFVNLFLSLLRLMGRRRD